MTWELCVYMNKQNRHGSLLTCSNTSARLYRSRLFMIYSVKKGKRKRKKNTVSVFVGARTSLPCGKNNRHFRDLGDESSTVACLSKLGLSILSISEIQNPSNLVQWQRKQFANKCIDNGFPLSPRHSEMYAQFNTHKQSALWMDPQIFLSLLFPSYGKAVNGPYHVKYIITRCHPLPWYEA